MSSSKVTLGGAIFEVTSRCNLNCRYCYNVHKIPGSKQPGRSSYKKARKTLSKLFSVADFKTLTFSGGEPLMAERLPELVLYARMKGREVTVITNGTAADHGRYSMLHDAGTNLFELPLHSDRSCEHDAMVGVPGAWNRVVQSIREIRKIGTPQVAVIVITRLNVERISATLAFLSELGITRVMLNRFNIGGAGIANQRELNVSGETLNEVFRRAEETATRTGQRLSSNVCTPTCVINSRDFPRISFGYCLPDISARPLTVDVDGNIRFCNHSPTIMGNLFDAPLKDIVDSDYVRDWKKQKPPVCEGCRFWKRCFGGCRAASEQLGKGLDCVDPILAPSNPPGP